METYKSILSSIVLLMAAAPTIAAQRSAQNAPSTPYLVDSVSISFPQGKAEVDRTFGDNAKALDGIDSRLTKVNNDSLYRLRHVSILGVTSPDGSLEINNALSKQRAEALSQWFDKYGQLDAVDKEFILLGRDWEGTLKLAKQDSNLPYKDETIALLQTIVDEKKALNGEEPANSLERMKALHGGTPYFYLYKNIFPALRFSKLIVSYDKILAPEIAEKRAQEQVVAVAETIKTSDADSVVVVASEVITLPTKKFYMDIRTNMLYDALALPNIGIDFYLGKNISIGANWMYGWWKTDKHKRYWRAYGGELNARWWFGKKAHEKPLSGHHLGIYGQAYTYDFEWGGKGQMGGKPGGNLWDKCLWAAGIEYGYSLPVARRINIDFSLGLGYTEGYYHKYHPEEGHYVWDSTHKRHMWGPTKLEVALVWLIGNGNANEKKGGKK